VQQRKLGVGTVIVGLLALGLIYGFASMAVGGIRKAVTGSHSAATATPTGPSDAALATQIDGCFRDQGVYDAWPQTIRTVDVSGASITLSTTLFNKDTNKQDARSIGQYALQCASDAGVRSKSVSVRASDGNYLLYGLSWVK